MRIYATVVPLLLLLALAGCGRGSTTPTATPAATPPQPPPAAAIPSESALFGAWDITIDPATMQANLDPVREGTAFGDSFWLNATGFLRGNPCGDCLSVSGISLDGADQIVVKFNVRHPFQPGNQQQPISGANRLDLHVFDAQLLILGDRGNFTVPAANAAILPADLVVGPAGYSDLLTSVVQTVRPDLTADTFPYVMVNEDPTAGNWAASNPNGFADPAVPTGHNIFPMGADVETPVTLALTPGDPTVRLTIMFTASYGQSAASRQFRLDPVYVLPEYHAKAPWRVNIDIPATANVLEEGNTSSTAQIDLAVFDWQASAPVDPTLNNIAAVRSPSEPTTVELYVPGILTAPMSLTPVSGTGPLNDPLLYSTIITNQLDAAEGTYYAAVRVLDSRTPGTNAGGATDALSSINGGSIDPVAVTQFSTWQIAPITVAAGPQRQLLSIDITPTARQIIAQGPAEAITFTAIGTFDTPPLTEDISATVSWISSATDVGTFATNVLTGVGMGRTYVHAEQGAISSVATNPATEVIVKPLELLSVANGFGYEIDAHQTDGEFYVSYTGPNRVVVYNESGIVQRQWNITDFLSFTRGITVDEALDIVYVGSGQPSEALNIIKYDTTGTRLTGFAPGSAAATWHFQGIVLLDNGQLWHRPFVPQTTYQYDVNTGAILDTWTGATFVSSVYDSDNVGNIMFHSNPGYRSSGRSIAIADPQAHQMLAWGGSNPLPPGYSQNTVIAVDRDNFIHLGWSVGAPYTNPLIEVFEYQAPNTILGPIYTYQPSVTGSSPNGIAVSRVGNVVALNSSSPARTTFFQ